MKYYIESIENLFKIFNTSEKGLNDSEAKDRLKTNGKNKLAEAKKKSIVIQFISQLCDPMIVILLVAAAISFFTSIYNNEPANDVYIILVVVALNSILSVIQENKAEQAIEALKNISKAKVKVIRENKQEIIDSEDLVVGDIVVIEAGDNIPCDMRIIEDYSFKIDESALTGESVPVEKTSKVITLSKEDEDIALADRINTAYMGTTCVYGRGKGLVVSTGMNTELGNIANDIINAKDEKTPLQLKLKDLSHKLTLFVLGICVIIFIASIIRSGNIDFGKTILPAFMVSISLAVAAIPEGLVAVVTIVLSIGVTHMAKKNAIIRKLTAVETLGSTQIICSDKTGTLTQNKMTVLKSWTMKENMNTFLAKGLALSSDSNIIYKANGVYEIQGEPTENALVAFAKSIDVDKNVLLETNKRIAEIPFDSDRKLMTTIYEDDNNEIVGWTKGGIDEILNICNNIAISSNEIVDIDEKIKNEIIKENKNMTSSALRVIALAYKKYDKKPDVSNIADIESNMCFVGIVGMIDPIRAEVLPAIKKCKDAGIRPVMITGDHKDTAIAIAKELTILQDENEALTGTEIDKMTDEEFDKSIHKYSVYARVRPAHKVKIVEAWKKQKKVVAMTGDGVNDAPSIKASDIGIGMGITGTDVTKNVSDMILLDDNFATIVNAVEEGRTIYSNIKKAVSFLISSNLSEVATIFIATIRGFTILKPPHLLWINLITDTFPALALSMEKAEDDIMKIPPRTDDNIITKKTLINVIYQGIAVSILTLVAYSLGVSLLFDPMCGTKEMQGMTMAFLTMSMAEIFHSINMRSEKTSIFKLKTKNYYLLFSMCLSLALTTMVIEVPFFSRLFNFANIDIVEYIVALLLAVLIIPIVEIAKKIQKNL